MNKKSWESILTWTAVCIVGGSSLGFVYWVLKLAWDLVDSLINFD